MLTDACMHQDDSDLIERSQAGDLAAFNLIVERYQTQVFNVAARILGDRSAADDVAQEAFISAHRALGGFRGGSLRAWLLRIASNAAYDYIRASRRRPEQSLDLAMENPSFSPPTGSESPEQHAERSELAAQLQQAILSLSDDQRNTLVLIDVQGLSYEETAESTGVSIGTVKSRLSRARRRAQVYLRENTDILPSRLRGGD